MSFRRPPPTPFEFDDLARYNAERARGLVHTDEWTERMRREQERFDARYHPPTQMQPRRIGVNSFVNISDPEERP